MIIKVLVDNNTFTDKYYKGEPALSFYIEVDNKKILFDTGYSDLFIQNAKLMGIDLSYLDYVVLSHGHNDHTGGLRSLTKILKNKPELITHPDTFNEKYDDDNSNIGFEKFCVEKYFNLNLTKKPIRINNNLVFLGEIPRLNDFEAKNNMGYCVEKNDKKPDFLFDDSALVYQSDNSINIITGCSHSGIINIINYAQSVCNTNKINIIIGGFHLLSKNKSLINRTVEELKKYNLQELYPCHCTGLFAKCELAKYFLVNEVGVSSKIVL